MLNECICIASIDTHVLHWMHPCRDPLRNDPTLTKNADWDPRASWCCGACTGISRMLVRICTCTCMCVLSELSVRVSVRTRTHARPSCTHTLTYTRDAIPLYFANEWNDDACDRWFPQTCAFLRDPAREPGLRQVQVGYTYHIYIYHTYM